jgi:hypothetical protein
MSTSTRAGLFRAWAVVTVCWVGGLAFFGLQAIGQNVAASKYICIPADPCRYQLYDPRQGVHAGSVRLEDGSELYFHRSLWQYRDSRYVDDIIEDFWQQRWLRYFGLMRPWLLLIALPGFLFILAYAMLWVVDGFAAPG